MKRRARDGAKEASDEKTAHLYIVSVAHALAQTLQDFYRVFARRSFEFFCIVRSFQVATDICPILGFFRG